jgi:hypothetical protein
MSTEREAQNETSRSEISASDCGRAALPALSPEKHLARQGVFGFLCGLETVLGVVLTQLDL